MDIKKNLTRNKYLQCNAINKIHWLSFLADHFFFKYMICKTPINQYIQLLLYIFLIKVLSQSIYTFLIKMSQLKRNKAEGRNINIIVFKVFKYIIHPVLLYSLALYILIFRRFFFFAIYITGKTQQQGQLKICQWTHCSITL